MREMPEIKNTQLSILTLVSHTKVFDVALPLTLVRNTLEKTNIEANFVPCKHNINEVSLSFHTRSNVVLQI